MRIDINPVFVEFGGAELVLTYFCEKGGHMLTRYYLEIDGNKSEIPQHCIKNWDEVKCAYKRTDYSGVTRSFTSQFEFVGEMREKLLELYLRDGFSAVAILSLYTINNYWGWDKQFSAPLDFSTLSWDDYVLKVNCVDNSLAALIKSRKSTKYEFVIGQDIPVFSKLEYDRIEMANMVNLEIMGNGDSTRYNDGSVVMVQSKDIKRLPTYVIGDAEVYENSPILYDDQTEDKGSYFLKIANQAPDLTLEIEINYYNIKQPFNSTVKEAEIYLMSFDSANPDINKNYTNLGTIFNLHETEWVGTSRKCLGCFSSLLALQKAYPNPPQDVYAIIGTSTKPADVEAVYFTPVALNTNIEWLQGRKSITGTRSNPTIICQERRFISKFSLGKYPAGTMFALAYKCSMTSEHSSLREYHVAIKSHIKASWGSRAKSIEIDAIKPEALLDALVKRMCDGKIDASASIEMSDIRLSKTYMLAGESVRGIQGAKMYSSFQDFCKWMETVFGYTYELGIDDTKSGNEAQHVRFIPREHLFSGDNVIELTNVGDFNYTVNKGLIYSNVAIGYDKQEYDAEGGRDEWNFSTQYDTGIDLFSTKLELISKYRADCYGLEFLSQERSKDTTDNKSDDSIFFVHCLIKTETIGEGDDVNEISKLVVDRSANMTGTLTDTVFNGEYSPVKCVKANASYIAAMHKGLCLRFASCDGNADVTIDGIASNSDISLNGQLFTSGEVEFVCGDIGTRIDADALYVVKSGGMTYSGFLMQADIHYSKNAAIKYKLIVKEIKI